MTIQDEHGSAKAWFRGDEAAFVFQRDDYEALLAAWKSGEAFFEGLDLYGDPLTLKLHGVVAVGLATPEGVERYKEDEQEIALT